jgi:O-antigen ligase
MKACRWVELGNSPRMGYALSREPINSSRFALIDLWIVSISGGILCLFPEFWFWCLLIASIPRVFRMVAGMAPIKRTGFEWLLAGFTISAGAGYWASYDAMVGSTKFFLIVASVFLFFAISSQPEENLLWVSAGMFCLGLGVSVFFLLTHDFLDSPRKLEIVNTVGRWIMQIRPALGWVPIHPNYASGIAAITSPFILYPLWKIRTDASKKILIPIVVAGLGIILLAIFMATSRGVLLAMAGAAGGFVIWRIVHSGRINLRMGGEAVFPSLVLIYLAAVVLLLYLGPASIGGNAVQSSPYGDGTRAEVFERSAYLVADFPFTGGGLGSYPGLYSQYILGIPYYYLPNAHNVFLDVFIEQGLPGGLCFLALYVAGIWQAARTIVKTDFPEMRAFCGLAFAALVFAFIHGMVDDYLYNGKGAILSMVPLGLAAIPMRNVTPVDRKPNTSPGFVILSVSVLMIGLLMMNLDRIQSYWHSNIGAVQMARVELAGFPVNQWTGMEVLPRLTPAETSLLSSLEADPANPTANHRLGLIAMTRRDFFSAAVYLEAAHLQLPGHRGITKALGYCYIWLGEFEKAQTRLSVIPEAEDELDAYAWWWQVQGRDDLSGRASTMRALLNNDTDQP